MLTEKELNLIIELRQLYRSGDKDAYRAARKDAAVITATAAIDLLTMLESASLRNEILRAENEELCQELSNGSPQTE